MLISKSFKVVLATSVMLTLVSCGNDNKKSSRAPEVQAITAHSWKIVNSKAFPATAMIEIGTLGNFETVIDECNAKRGVFIDNARNSVTFLADAPQGETVTVNVYDRAGCGDLGEPMTTTTGFTVNVVGEMAEVLIKL